MLNNLPPLNEIFPFEYKGGGYFRLKGVPKEKKAPILHGEEAIIFFHEKLKEILTRQKTMIN